MERDLYEVKIFLNRMDENTYNASRRKPEPYRSGTIDEIVVRLSNAGRTPNPAQKIMSSSKQHCVGDYSCCGQMP